MSIVMRADIPVQVPDVADMEGGGLLAGTLVFTAEGALPVELLGPGDRVVTRQGFVRVAGVACRSRRAATVMRIAPDALGVGRPAAPLFVAPGQRLMVSDWRARALWGCAAAAVPALRLADGRTIRAETRALAHFITLVFQAPQAVLADGATFCFAAAADQAAPQPVAAPAPAVASKP